MVMALSNELLAVTTFFFCPPWRTCVICGGTAMKAPLMSMFRLGTWKRQGAGMEERAT